MRAIYLANNFPEFQADHEFELFEGFHHLKNVVRLKKGEKIKLLDGKGHSIICETITIGKKSIELTMKSHLEHNRAFEIDVALGITKKSSFSDMVKLACEMGINKVIPLKCEFSQKWEFNEARMESLVESAMNQSNNPFLVEVTEPIKLDLLELKKYEQVFLLHPYCDKQEQLSPLSPDSKTLLIIGPEAGLSESEGQAILKQGAQGLSLPTPLLRAPTALCVGVGHLLANYLA